LRSSHWRRHRWAWLIGTAYVCIAAWVWVACQVGPKPNPDACDYAQMGREIYRGHGFATTQMMPRHIPFLDEHGYLDREHWFNFSRFPLPAMTDAAFCFVTDDAMMAAVLKSGTFFVLSVPLLFLLAYRYASLAVATVSTLFFMADPLVFGSSYVGKTETLSMFLILCVALTAFSKELTLRKCALMGILAGLCYLSRSQFIFLVPVLFLMIGLRIKGRGRMLAMAMAVTGGAALLVVAPWLARNYALVGNPMFSFITTRSIVTEVRPIGADLMTDLHAPVSTTAVLKEYGVDIVRKYARHLFPNILSISFWRAMLDPGVFPFFFFTVLSLFRREGPGQKHVTLWKWFVMAMVVCNILVAGLVVLLPRYFIMFHPLVILLGAREVMLLLGALPGRAEAWFRIIVVIGMLSIGVFQFTESAQKAMRKYRPHPQRMAALAQIKQMTQPGTLIASDRSYDTVVYTDRRSLRLPEDPEQLLEIDEKYLAVDYVHLSAKVLKGGPHLKDQPSRHATFWQYPQYITATPFTSKYKLMARLVDGGVLFKRIKSK